jgi:hypothetical protein
VASDIRVRVIGDTSSFEKAMSKSSKSANSFGKSLAKAGKFAAIGFGALGAGAVVAGKRMIDMASDAAEVQSKMDVVFGKALPGLTKEIDKFSAATGTSRFEMREQAADMGALLKPLVGTSAKAADMSLQFTKLASDLGSFNNVPTADALLAIRSGLVGEAEPLRRFGVLLNEAAVNQEGLRLGLIKGNEQLTEQEKVQARANLIMQQTTLAQGDATRTAGSMANQLKALKTNISDAATELGIALLPTALKVVQAFNTHWPQIKSTAQTVFAAVGAAIKAVTPTIQAIIDMTRKLVAAAREAWPQVQQAAQRVMAWYQGTLKPAIQNVIAAITAFWDKFGADISKIAKIAFGTLAKVVGNALKIVQAVIEGVLAVIRGDWSQAWNSLKTVVTTVFSSIGAIIKGFASIAFAAATAIGRGLIDGIIAGVSGLASRLKDSVTSQIQGAISGIKGAFGIGSPSKVTAKEIGGPLAEGVGMGFVNGMKKVNAALLRELTATGKQLAAIAERRAREDRAAAVRSAIAAVAEARKNKEGLVAAERDLARAREDIVVANLERTMAREQAVYDRRQTLIQGKMDKLNAAIQKAQDKQAAIFDQIRGKVMTAFEAVRGGMRTPAEKALAELNESATQRDLQRALNDAIASGDAQAILRAQEDIQRNSLEKQAATERTALDQQTEALREKLGEKLGVWKGGTASILSMLSEFGIDFANVGVLLGTAFRDSLISAIGGGGAVTPAVAGGSGIAARSQAWNQAYQAQGLMPSSSVVNVYGDVTGTQLVETVRREINRIQKQNSRTGYV